MNKKHRSLSALVETDAQGRREFVDAIVSTLPEELRAGVEASLKAQIGIAYAKEAYTNATDVSFAVEYIEDSSFPAPVKSEAIRQIETGEHPSAKDLARLQMEGTYLGPDQRLFEHIDECPQAVKEQVYDYFVHEISKTLGDQTIDEIFNPQTFPCPNPMEAEDARYIKDVLDILDGTKGVSQCGDRLQAHFSARGGLAGYGLADETYIDGINALTEAVLHDVHLKIEQKKDSKYSLER